MNRIIAFTGAGISKQSGIPTFTEREDYRQKMNRSFAINHPDEYNTMIKELKYMVDKALPNDAHIALKEYGVFVITMNIDSLHSKAGSEALELHGHLPDYSNLDKASFLYNQPVLYGDPAINYNKAIEIVSGLESGDFFIVIGCSYYTNISVILRDVAKSRGATIIEIQTDAKNNVRDILEKIANK